MVKTKDIEKAKDKRPQVISFINFCSKVLHLELTDSQRTIAKICFDKKQYYQLTDEEKIIARQIFGMSFNDNLIIPNLAFREIILRLGRGAGKTTLSSAYALYRVFTADIEQCGPGDKPTFMVVAPVSKLATVALDIARGLIEQASFLMDYVISSKLDEIIIKRPNDDRLASIMIVNKSKAGTNMRGRSIIDLLIDESEFMPPEEAGKTITDKDIISGASPRIIRSGKIILISTPFPTPSYTADSFEKNFDHPKTAIAALGSTLTMRGNDTGIAEMIELERARDPVNALREYDCISTNAVGGFFDTFLIDSAVQENIEFQNSGRISAGIDLGFAHDCSAQVIIERQLDKIVVINTTILTPQPKQPLKPSEVLSSFTSTSRNYNCNIMMADQHYYHLAAEYGAMRGVQVVSGPRTLEETYIYLRDLFKEGKVIIPNNSILMKQLKSILYQSKANNTGIKIILPREGSAGHTDLVSAFIMAVHLDKRFGILSSTATNCFSTINKNNKTYHPFLGFSGNGGMESW